MRLAVGFAVGTFLLHLAVMGGYGFHRDELYLLACGKQLAWGSLDHAPITPALSWLSTSLFGDTAFAQRVVGALAGALVVAVTGLITRRLGGGLRAQALAMGSIVIAPAFIYTRGVFATNAIDQLAWVLATYCLVVALEGRRLAWLALGLVIGVGLLDKYTILVYAFALFVALLATAPRQLRAPWPYLAAL